MTAGPHPGSADGAGPAGPAFDVRMTRDVAQSNRFSRIGFALVYAALSLLILPWQAS